MEGFDYDEDEDVKGSKSNRRSWMPTGNNYVIKKYSYKLID